MRALVVANSNDADPGFVGERFRHHGYAFSEAHREYPAEWPEMPGHDLILLLGSEWSVYWDHISGEVAAETALVQAANQAGIPIFGICFGGQLMARALGGSVARSPKAELGWYEIESDDKTLIPTGPWFEYHWDRWTLPKGALEIARTEIASQAFVMGRTLGVQFHPEIDPEVLEEWLAMEGGCAEVEREGVVVDQLRAQTKKEKITSDKRAFDLVNAFLRRIATSEVEKVN